MCLRINKEVDCQLSFSGLPLIQNIPKVVHRSLVATYVIEDMFLRIIKEVDRGSQLSHSGLPLIQNIPKVVHRSLVATYVIEYMFLRIIKEVD
jgi:hypothetical protein